MCINPPHSIILDLVTVSFIGLGKKTIKLHEVIVIQTFHYIEDFIKYTMKPRRPLLTYCFTTSTKHDIYLEIGQKSF